MDGEGVGLGVQHELVEGQHVVAAEDEEQVLQRLRRTRAPLAVPPGKSTHPERFLFFGPVGVWTNRLTHPLTPTNF